MRIPKHRWGKREACEHEVLIFLADTQLETLFQISDTDIYTWSCFFLGLSLVSVLSSVFSSSCLVLSCSVYPALLCFVQLCSALSWSLALCSVLCRSVLFFMLSYFSRLHLDPIILWPLSNRLAVPLGRRFRFLTLVIFGRRTYF